MATLFRYTCTTDQLKQQLPVTGLNESMRLFSVDIDPSQAALFRNAANRRLNAYAVDFYNAAVVPELVPVSSTASALVLDQNRSFSCADQLMSYYSYFKTIPDCTITLAKLYEQVLSGEHLAKKQLPLVTVSSDKGRKKTDCRDTGLVQIDCDHFGATMADVDRVVENIPFAVMAIHSPSEDGVKVICRVEKGAGFKESAFCCMWQLAELFNLKIYSSKQKSSACIDKATLNSVQLMYVPQGRYVALSPAAEVMVAPRMAFAEVDDAELDAKICVPQHAVADEGMGRHNSLFQAVGALAGRGASLPQIKAALPSRSSDPTEIDRIYEGQQVHKRTTWTGMKREVPFDSYEDCCAEVKARFMSLYRVDAEVKNKLFTLDGEEFAPAKSDALLNDTTNFYATASGLSSISVKKALANSGELNYFCKKIIDFSRPRGLVSTNDMNLRAPLIWEQADEQDVNEELMATFLREYDQYFRSRSTGIAKCYDGAEVPETTLLAAFFAMLCDTQHITHRPCAVFIQGLQGSGKSTCGEDTAARLFGEEAFSSCQGWIGKSNFTVLNYEKSRIVCIQEARPTSTDMPAFKQAIRGGDERIEYKGETAFNTKTQHGFLLTTNDDFVPAAITEDRAILVIGMDNVADQPSDLVHDWISEGLCPWPVALAKRLKSYFEQLGGASMQYVRVTSCAPVTLRRNDLTLNKISDDKYVITATCILRDAGTRLTADELAARMCEKKLNVNSRSLGIRLKTAVKSGVFIVEKEHTMTTTTTYYSLPAENN